MPVAGSMLEHLTALINVHGAVRVSRGSLNGVSRTRIYMFSSALGCVQW